MNTTHSDRLIEQYMQRLADAAASLPAGERDDLLADIREHIAVALDEEEHVDEATIHNLLDRLGAPDEVVEAASVGSQRPASEPTASAAGGGIEAAAVVTLVLSPLVPGLGWIIGAVLTSASRSWSRHEKLVALVAVPAACVGLAAALLFLGPYLPDPVVFEVLDALFPLGNLAALLLAGPAGAAYLAWRRRAATQRAPLAPAPAGPLAWAAVVVLLLSWAVPLLGWVAGAVMVGVSQSWSRREKVIGIVAIPLATIVVGAVAFVLHRPGVDLPIDSPVALPATAGAVPVYAMGTIGAVYLGWRLVVGLRAAS